MKDSQTKSYYEIEEKESGIEGMAQTMEKDWKEIAAGYPEIYRVLIAFKNKIVHMDSLIESIEIIIDEHLIKEKKNES